MTVLSRASDDARGVAKKYRDVKRIMRAAGWRRLRSASGSHETWISPTGVRITVAGGGSDNKEVPVGTLSKIRRLTGLKDLR